MYTLVQYISNIYKFIVHRHSYCHPCDSRDNPQSETGSRHFTGTLVLSGIEGSYVEGKNRLLVPLCLCGYESIMQNKANLLEAE